MKNFLNIFLIFTVFLTSSSVMANEESLNENMQELIPYYRKMAKCVPTKQEDVPVIQGITNGQCKYYRIYTVQNGVIYPLEECSIPLPIINAYANQKIGELYSGQFVFDPIDNILGSYCKKKSFSIKTEYGEITY